MISLAACVQAKSLSRCLRFSLSLVVLLASWAAIAQAQQYRGGANARALVDHPINESKLVRLVGNTHPAAIAANDRGALPDSKPMEHMQLVLQRPPELERELEKLIDDQQTKGSPNYHKWLTAEEFGQRFGVSQQDIATVSAWLEGHGFRVDSVPTSGMFIEFSGTAGQVKSAFHTEMHSLEVDGKAHFANMGDPQIPEALTGVVKGVHALHDFMPHSMKKQRPNFTFDCPVPTYCNAATTFYAVTPADLATIYNFGPAYAAGITGAGQTVVVIEDTLLQNTSDVATFRSAFGLSGYTGTFAQVTATGSTTCNNSGVNGDEGEAALDAEWAGAAAPNAAIELASCADASTVFGGLIALQNLINGANPPPIVSISYGECEAANGGAANASYVSAYQQAATLGTSVFVSSGDEGAASCDANRTVATHGIAVSGFASTPYNVAVGGTDFADTYESMQPSGTPVSNYWAASNTSAFGSALSYIPEIPWNNSCASELLYTTYGFTQAYGTTGMCNSTATDPFGGTYEDYRTTTAGSGGPSNYSSQPSWQTGLGVPTPSGGMRYIPDVSLFAANGVWNHFFEYCLSDTAQNGVPCDYTNATDSVGLAAGGTSFSSPIMAGVQALVNQANRSLTGNPNYRYYNLANTESGAAGNASCNSSLGPGEASYCVFNDVTLGDIDLNCTGTTNCFGSTSRTVDGALSSTPNPLTIAYGTDTGWDFATGLGTVNVYNLIKNWDGVVTSTAVTSGSNPGLQGTSVTFTATVAPVFGSGASGTVSWSGNTGCSTSTVSGVTATCTTSSLPSGSDLVTATYSGDTNFAGSNGSLSETINSPAATLTTPAPSSTLTGSSVTFAWTTGTGASQYLMHVGTSGAGSSNIVNTGSLHTTSTTISGIPTMGATLYVRLYSYIAGAWQFNDYTYTESSPAPAVMSTPAPSSTLSGSSVTFTWTTGNNVSQYLMHVGTTGAGSSNVVNTGSLTTTSTTINSIPTNGATLNVRLYSFIAGAWQYNDYTYTEASSAPAVMSTPAPSSTLSASSVTFTWTAGIGVSQYLLHVGTTGAGSTNIVNTGSLTTTSTTISGIPTTGAVLYVRLYSYIAGAWQYNDYTYTEGSPAPAVMITPAPSSTLSGSSVTFSWTAGNDVSQYLIHVGTTGAGSSDIFNTGSLHTTSATINGIPTTGATLNVRLYSYIAGAWQYNDYTYTEQ